MATAENSPFNEQSSMPVISPEGLLASLPTENYDAALRHGFTRAVPMISPEGKTAYLPEDKVQDAIGQNFKPAMSGAGGGWEEPAPKEPGALDTANNYWSAPAQPGESLLHRLYRSAGRTAMIAPNLANAVASPITDPITDEERQAHGVGRVTTAIINRLGLPYKHLVDDPAIAEARKASADWKQPGILNKISGAGHELAAAIPFVGPAAASIGERMGTGDVAGGAADLATMAALPKVADEAAPGGRLPGAPATDELAMPATRALAGKVVDTTGNAIQAVRGAISPDAMTAEQAATKAFRPRNSKANWKQEIQSSLPDARRAANSLGIDVNQMSLDDALKATSQAKKDVWNEYQQNFSGPNASATVDTTPVAGALRKSVSDRQIEQNPAFADKVSDIADSYSGRKMNLAEVEDRVRELNNETRGIEAKYLTDKRAAKLDPQNAPLFAERDGLRQLLLSKLDDLAGPGAAELRKRYGALNSLEDVISRRIPVADRAAPENLPTMWAKAKAAGKIARGVFTFSPGDVIEGGMSLLSQRRSSLMNNPEFLTQQAFRKTQPRGPARIPAQFVSQPPSALTGIAKMLPRGAYEQPAGNPPPDPLQLEHMQPVEGEYVQPPMPPIKGLLKRGQFNVPPTGVEDMMPSQPQLPAKATAIPLPASSSTNQPVSEPIPTRSTSGPAIARPSAQQHQTIQPKGAGYGAQTQVLNSGPNLPGRYRVMEADSLIPSHDAGTFAQNPKYPAGVQERTYHSSKEAQNRVVQQAQNYDPNYTINTNPDAVNGPPIVTKDGVVLGGNSRTMSTQRIYAAGKGDAYKNELMRQAGSFGLDPQAIGNMNKPVLVREVTPQGGVEGMRRLATDLNKSMTGSLGIEEKAVSAGRSISPDTLDTIGAMRDRLGEDATLRDVLREHGSQVLNMLTRDGVVTDRERPGLVDTTTGGLSDEGKKFTERALLGSVVDDPVLMEHAPKSVLDKVGGSLGELASLGSREDEWNILPLVREALADHAEMASTGQNIATYLKQPRMFGAQRSPAVEAVVRTLGAKPRAVRQALRDFADAAHASQPNQPTLGLTRVPSAAEAFNEAFRSDISDTDLMQATRNSMAREMPHDVERFSPKTK
jgi:DdrB-like nuclease